MASPVPLTPVHEPLTEAEANVLVLFDQLEQLQLELALLGSQQSHHVAAGQSPQFPRRSAYNSGRRIGVLNLCFQTGVVSKRRSMV